MCWAFNVTSCEASVLSVKMLGIQCLFVKLIDLDLTCCPVLSCLGFFIKLHNFKIEY